MACCNFRKGRRRKTPSMKAKRRRRRREAHRVSFPESSTRPEHPEARDLAFTLRAMGATGHNLLEIAHGESFLDRYIHEEEQPHHTRLSPETFLQTDYAEDKPSFILFSTAHRASISDLHSLLEMSKSVLRKDGQIVLSLAFVPDERPEELLDESSTWLSEGKDNSMHVDRMRNIAESHGYRFLPLPAYRSMAGNGRYLITLRLPTT